MEQAQLMAHCGSAKITREELKVIPTPAGSPRGSCIILGHWRLMSHPPFGIEKLM